MATGDRKRSSEVTGERLVLETQTADGHTTYTETQALVDQDGVPLPMGAPVCLGVYVLSCDTLNAGNDLATLIDVAGGTATTLAEAIAAGLNAITATVETNPIKVNFIGGDPATAGHLYAKDNGQPYVWDCSDFTLIHITGSGGTASVTITLWG